MRSAWVTGLGLLLGFLPWAKSQEIAPATVDLGAPEASGQQRIWRTDQLVLEADDRVPVAAVQRLAVLEQSTAGALKAFGLPLFAPPRHSVPEIAIFSDPAAYEQAGAAKGSAGFYLGRRGARVLIRADYFLNAVVVQRTAATPKTDEDLAVHEFVHLGMHEKMASLPPWLIDGIAEYFSSAHSSGGKFSFAQMDDSVRDHLRGKLGSTRDLMLRLVPIEKIINLDGAGWIQLMEDLPPEDRYRAYGSALLLTHYYLHGGPDRLQEVRELLEKTGRWNRENEIVKEDSTALEAKLAKFWKRKGLLVEFR